MDTIISVQDIRSSLASISKRVESGETFTVVRNSKPAFRIVPIAAESLVRESSPVYRAEGVKKRSSSPSAAEIRRSFREAGADKAITPEELNELIHEVHDEYNRKVKKEGTEG